MRNSRLYFNSNNDSSTDMINYKNNNGAGEPSGESSLSQEEMDVFGRLQGMNLDEKNFESRASRMIMQFQQWTGETNSASTPERKGFRSPQIAINSSTEIQTREARKLLPPFRSVDKSSYQK